MGSLRRGFGFRKLFLKKEKHMAKSMKKSNDGKKKPKQFIFPDMAIEVAETMTPTNIGFMTETLLRIANVQAENGNKEQAAATVHKAMEYLVKDKSKIADEVSLKMDNHKLLCAFLEKYGTRKEVLAALDIQEAAIAGIKDSYIKMNEYLLRAEIAGRAGDKKRADSYIEKACEVVWQMKKPKKQIGLLRYVIWTCSRLGRKKKAEQLFDKGFSLGQGIDIESMIPGFSTKKIVDVVNRAKNDETRYEFLNLAALRLGKVGQNSDAAVFFEKAFTLLESMDESEGRVDTFLRLAQNAMIYGAKDVASRAMTQAKKIATEYEVTIPLLVEFSFLVDSGNLKQGEFVLKRLPKNYRLQAGAHIQLAVRYFRQGNRKEAIRLLVEAEKAADKGEKDRKRRFYQIIGLYWSAFGEPNRATTTFEKCQKTNLYCEPAKEMLETALFQIAAEDFPGALATIEKSMKLVEKMKPTRNQEEVAVQAALCETLLRCGEPERAKAIFEKYEAVLSEKPKSSWPEDVRRKEFALAMVCKMINTFPLEWCFAEVDPIEGPKRLCRDLQHFM